MEVNIKMQKSIKNGNLWEIKLRIEEGEANDTFLL